MGLDKTKTEINRHAKNTSSTVQSVWDMYFFEHFLYRIAKSEYTYNFIFKGGFLLETILGIEMRSTTDIDLKANNIKLDDEQLKSV